MEDSVQTLGVDLRTRFKRFGAKEKTRRKKSKVRFSIIKRNKSFRRTWRAHAVKMVLTERFQLRRQMAAAAGKKSTTSLSLFMAAFGHPVLGRRCVGWRMAPWTKGSLARRVGK